MADASPDGASDDPWSELEHGFFAAAPPEVPGPPPEPMRFDDLDPVGPAPPRWHVRLSRELTAARPGRMLQAAVRAARRRSAPALARAWERASPALARAWRRSVDVSAAVVKRSALALAAARLGARNHRLIAAGAAALIAVMGVSAGVVASRGGAGATIAGAPIAAGSAAATAGVARAQVSEKSNGAVLPAALDPSAAAEPWLAARAGESREPIAGAPPPAPRPRRKHAKHPARQVVRVKPAKPVPVR